MHKAPLELFQTAVHIGNYEKQEGTQKKLQVVLSDNQKEIEEVILPPVQKANQQIKDHEQVIENHCQLKEVTEERMISLKNQMLH